MKIKDLKKGEIYYTHCDGGWLIKFSGKEKDIINGSALDVEAKNFYGDNCGWGDIEQFNENKPPRLATYEEKQWMEACIKADKFIPLKQCKFDIIYEIY